MAPDGAVGAGGGGQKKGVAGFVWCSSSPSPGEIERLESAFPEVVSVPVEELETEMVDWQLRAIIARSFQKWVPAEAFVREFRRAGIQGEIKPVSMAFRCHVFRFEDQKAIDLVLNRPWIINGQIIGMERWKPEFIPSVDAIPFALVWLRLPNLPLEFWKEDFLRAITESAGQFHCVDASTVAKNRGGFARVCLRVDLRRPLRPGTRLQGINLPFWQQFVYEYLEGFCPSCGSLHLEGPCSVPDVSSKEEGSSSPVFGAWMAAVRQRRADAKQETSSKYPLKTASNAGVSVPSSQPNQVKFSAAAVDPDGWRVPAKVARRKTPSYSKRVIVSDLGAGDTNGEVHKGRAAVSSPIDAVPDLPQCAGTVDSENNTGGTYLKLSAVTVSSKSQTINNPFASCGSGLVIGGDQRGGDVLSGPLKRARPVDCPSPRSISKNTKRKGKEKLILTKSSNVDHYLPVKLSLPICSSVEGQVAINPCSEKIGGLTVEVSAVDTIDRPPDPLSSVQALRNASLEGDVGGSKDAAVMMIEGGTIASECLPEMVMLEDRGGAPVSPSIK